MERERQNISLDKQKEMFYKLVAEKTGEIEKLYDSVNFQNLVHQFKGPTKNINCNDFIDADTLFNYIKCKKIRLEDVENNQVKFEYKLSNARAEGNKSGKELSEIENITRFYKSREKIF